MPRHAPITAAGPTRWLNVTAMIVLGAAAFAALGATIAGALDLLPFLTLELRFGDVVFAGAGMAVQIGVTILLLCLVAALPAMGRVLALERSHRTFTLTMADVADAYRACHAADRRGVFTLASEFDAVKERITYLRTHPDLGNLEPDVIETAAQMSQASRMLAETYSDENVARARDFLRHRQEEIALFEERIECALAAGHELRRHHERLEVEESVIESRLARLEEEFGDLLRGLGFKARRGNVVAIPAKVKAAE
ncbi:hypothetical protein LX81_00952 [Palleronia aestuarii]|uniref:DNA repair protein n=1 Tax=Palleronia aestuarii TaxID=568105 RepID=A0A2W7NFP6_9RHOB|nr:DNA repair protein [Palleronia aestuarii]PZX18323.1 hypothetical protein LX81_00952 [Palleronia aestuarii]